LPEFAIVLEDTHSRHAARVARLLTL
jgi:hypothetical protein